MKTYGGVEIELHALLAFALDGVSGQLQASSALPLGKEPPVATELAQEPTWTSWWRDLLSQSGTETRIHYL
jgi:hypothetical protein